MVATDNFAEHVDSINESLESFFAITPHDTNELAYVTRAVYVGAAGTLKIKGVNDSDWVTLTGLVSGVWHPIRVKAVHTDSTATGIIGGY
jgi:hypothetical protein